MTEKELDLLEQKIKTKYPNGFTYRAYMSDNKEFNDLLKDTLKDAKTPQEMSEIELDKLEQRLKIKYPNGFTY